MSEQVEVPSQHRRASPWPVFVALGFALAELGIFVGLLPIAVGGLLLLAGSVAGILVESGYSRDLWRPLAVLGGVFTVLGVVIAATQVDPGSLAVLGVPNDPNGVLARGLSIAGAGTILLAGSVTGHLFE
ncbi:MAG: DUF7541 family protein [archaeon]